MKKMISLFLALCMVLSCTAFSLAEGESEVTLICDGSANYKLQAEDRDRDFDGNYVFAKYFLGGTQEDMLNGIKALIAQGAASINGFALPAKTEDMTADEEGRYAFSYNGSAAFTVEAGAAAEAIVEEGLKALTTAVKSAGTNVTFTLDGNGLATSMSLFITRGALVEALEDQGDGTSLLIAQGEPYAIAQGGMGGPGGPGMGGPQKAPVVVAFPNANIDPTVAVGDIAVCYETPDGWFLKAADRMDGYLIGGADHEDYLFKDTAGTVHYFKDADMYQRAFATQNRPGGFVNTQVNFKLTDGEYLVTAWFVPGTASTEKPMIIGFTTGGSARARLAAAIAYATWIADNTVVASSREEAGEGVDWVEDASTIETLRKAIAVAQEAYDREELTSSAYDGAVYNLHLAVWGSMNDISAVFMGTAVEGFYDIANPDVEKTHVVLK